MEDATSSQAPLSFYTLLDHLSQNGFRIGVDTHLRLQRLLRQVSGHCSPDQLRTLLCPILATNRKEQEFFYSAYDRYFALNQPSGSAQTRIAKRGTLLDRKKEPIWARIWPYIACGLIVTIILAFASYRYKQQTQVASPQGIQTTFRIPADTTVIDQPVPEMIYAIRWVAVLGPLLLFLLYETYRRNRHRLQLKALRRNDQPHVFSIYPRSSSHFFESSDFNNAIRLLRGRQQAEFSVLDLQATVLATTKLLGYPQFRYKPASRVPEYVVLIERSSRGDHLQNFFDQLVNALERDGLAITRYYFEGDPRVCFRSEVEENPTIARGALVGERSVPLSVIYDKHEDNRFVILGTGEGLFDPIAGTLNEWTTIFQKWKQRVLMTPIPRDEWSHREETLSRHFFVAPAVVKGIQSIALYFERTDAAYDPLILSKESVLWPDTDSPGVIGSLKAYLGSETFQWLCACAVYPRLEWDLTVFLRSLPCLKDGISDEVHLLRLLRLPWFQSGFIPQALREQMLKQLSPELYLAIREAIVGLLSEALPDAQLDRTPSLKVAVPHAHRLFPQDLVKRLINMRLRGRIVRDYIFVRFLESKPNRLMDFWLPNRFRGLFFPNGNSALGLRVVTRLVLSMIFGTALWIMAPVIVRAIKTEPTLSAQNLRPSGDLQPSPAVTPTPPPLTQVSPVMLPSGSPVQSDRPAVPVSTPQPTSTTPSTATPQFTPVTVPVGTVGNPSPETLTSVVTPTLSPIAAPPTPTPAQLAQCPEVKVVCSIYSQVQTKMNATTYSATATTSGGKQLSETEYVWSLFYDQVPATKEQGRIKAGHGKSTVEIEWVIKPNTTPVLTAKVVVTGYNAACFTENSCTVPVRESPRDSLLNQCECGTCGGVTCCAYPGMCIGCGSCGYVCCSSP